MLRFLQKLLAPPPVVDEVSVPRKILARAANPSSAEDQADALREIQILISEKTEDEENLDVMAW